MYTSINHNKSILQNKSYSLPGRRRDDGNGRERVPALLRPDGRRRAVHVDGLEGDAAVEVDAFRVRRRPVACFTK